MHPLRNPIHVDSEWGELKSAFVHGGDNAKDLDPTRWGADIVKTHPESGLVVAEKLREEVAAFHALLRRYGVELHESPTQEGAYCQVFTRDPLFVVGKIPFLGSMGERYRDAEVLGARQFTQEQSLDIADLDDAQHTAKIEGGDVFSLSPELVLVGSGEITTPEGIEAFRRILHEREGSHNRIIECIPHSALHLDCAYAPLPDGSALLSAMKLPKESVDILSAYHEELDELDSQEAARGLASNLFWLNPETVFSSTSAPKTNRKLRDRGYEVLEVPYDQLIHEWGSVRCTVCPLERH